MFFLKKKNKLNYILNILFFLVNKQVFSAWVRRCLDLQNSDIKKAQRFSKLLSLLTSPTDMLDVLHFASKHSIGGSLLHSLRPWNGNARLHRPHWDPIIINWQLIQKESLNKSWNCFKKSATKLFFHFFSQNFTSKEKYIYITQVNTTTLLFGLKRSRRGLFEKQTIL